jgi:hypothetical protein
MGSPVRITAPFAKPEDTARVLGAPSAHAREVARTVYAALGGAKVSRVASAAGAKKRTASRSAGAAKKASGAHHGAKRVRSRKAGK